MAWILLVVSGRLRNFGERLEIFALRRMPEDIRMRWLQSVWVDRADGWQRISEVIQQIPKTPP